MNMPWRWFFSVVFLVSFGGCNPSDRKPTAKVSVEVLHKGKPVDGAVVTSAIANESPPAIGTTDANGKCELSSYEASDGALIGTHAVTVMKQKFGKGKEKKTGDIADDTYDPGFGYSPPPVVEDLLPAKYKLPASSGLSKEVKKGKNEFKIELE
jgi:hypothetical protein